MCPAADLKNEALPPGVGDGNSVHYKEPVFDASSEAFEDAADRSLSRKGSSDVSEHAVDVDRSRTNGSETGEHAGEVDRSRTGASNAPEREPVPNQPRTEALGTSGHSAKLVQPNPSSLAHPFNQDNDMDGADVKVDIKSLEAEGHDVKVDIKSLEDKGDVETACLGKKSRYSLVRHISEGCTWLFRICCLVVYATFLLPGFVQVGYQYFSSKHVHRGILYGDKHRNKLDLYLPDKTDVPRPVVLFVTGGAWIIGYKAWGALLGIQLLRRNIIVVSIDYRNFPEVGISAMVEDVSNGIDFVMNNIVEYGGDPNRIHLVGQSAGAHLAALVLVDQSRIEVGLKEGTTTWRPSRLKGFVGLSGGYNLPRLVDHFQSRGLYHHLFLDVMEGETSLALQSPELVVQSESFSDAVSVIPPMHLFHGTADYSIPYDASVNFGNALRAVGAKVTVNLYPDKTHTDVLLQDPMRGGNDPLFNDLVALVHANDEEAKADDAKAPLRPRLVPECLLQLARKVSPF